MGQALPRIHSLPQGHAPMGWQTGGVLWKKRAVLKNYGLLGAMLAAMLTGGVTESWLGLPPPGPSIMGQISCSVWWCAAGVFSIAGAIAGMRSVRRAGRIMGVTVLTFVVTGIPRRRADVPVDEGISPVLTPWQSSPGRKGFLPPPRSAAGKFLHRRGGFRGPAEPPGHAASHRLFLCCWASPPIHRRPLTARWPRGIP